MDGTAILALLNSPGLISGGVLTLQPGSALNSSRVDALLAGVFGGKLVAPLGAPKTGATSVSFPDAKLATANFAFYPKSDSIPAVLTFATGKEGQLDLALTATLADGWTFAASFPDIGKLDNASINALALSAVSVAVDSAVSANDALLTATIDSAKSAIAQFDWLLGASVTIKGALGFVTNTKGEQAPSFTLSSAPIQGPAVSGFTFDVYLNVRCGPAAEALSDGSVPLLPAVDLTAELIAGKLTLPILVSITSKDQSLYPIRLDPTAQVPQLTSLDDLSGFTFGSSPGAVLADAKPFGALSLDFLFATFDAKNKGFSNLVFKISLGTQWKVIDDIFELDGLFAQVSVPALLKGGSPPDGAPSFSVALGAVMEISTAKLVATATFPDQTLSLALAEGSTVDINAFMQRFAKNVSLPGSSTLVIRQFDALADIKGASYHLSVEADGELSVIPKFTLTEIRMSITYAQSAVAEFGFACNFTIAGAPLVLDVAYDGAQKTWAIQGGSQPGTKINLSALVADLLDIFGVTLPTDLPAIVLTLLEMSYDTGTGKFSFDCEIGYVDESDPILEKLTGKIAIAYSGREAKTWTGHVQGTIEIGHNNLVTATLDFQKTKTLSLQWKAENEKTVGIADLCALVGIPSGDIPDIPSDLDLALVELDGTYDITNKVVMLGVVSKTWGNADVVLSKNAEGKWDLFLALKTGKTISLSSLPLIGSPLSSVVGDVSLDDIQFYAAQPVLTKEQAGIIGGYIDTLSRISGASYPKPPADGLSAKAALTMDFHVGEKTTPLSLGTAKSANDQGGKKPAPAKQFAISDAAPAGASSAPAQTQTASGSDSTKWFTIQKSFGPVSIQKVGVRYEESTLWALLDASLDAGGLTIALHGLGMGSGLKSFDPKFTVSGIDVTLVEGPIEASGGLIGTIDPVNLYGELMLKMPEFALGALAGFAMVDKHPSFFLYATLLAPPLGGPAFFYVTGLAAGIGFNRSLVIPAVDGVSTFPFIEWAMGSSAAPTSVPGGDVGQQVKDVLSTLANSGVVAPQVGEYWLAAGVHFTSFELVESFALLTVKFGADFELDLLGLSRLTLPPTGTPVALIEIELKASFSPSAGLLAISGQLSPRSYVLSESCHLAGGFAFYSWFSGEHEGDFVISIGGYSPRFDVPKHYPVVPRLGLRWQVSDQLTISGDEYFALTSSAVMAGGGLSAVWDGGPVSAWFSVEVDFLLIYKPFHYYLSASCQLGASFSIDLLFTTITITIHLGVGLEIWGPEFTGVATVDLSIISFSIDFGASNQDASQTIEWHEFLDQLLPKKPAPPTKTEQSRTARHIAAAAAVTPAVDPVKDPAVDAAVVQMKMTNGLLKTLSETGEETLNYIVDSQHFEMEVSAIPSKDALFPQNPRAGFKAAPIDLPDALQPTDEQGKIIQPNTLFGVGPVGLAPGDYTATLTVEIDSSADVKFHAVRILKNVSKAFWEKPAFSDDGKSVPKLDPLKDTTITNVLVGFQIIPFVTPPDKTRPIDLEYLKYTVDEEHIESFRWSAPIVPGADNFSTETVAGTLDDPNHAAKIRPALLRAINGAGFAVAQTIDAGDLGDAAKTYLGDAPVLALLGEAK